MVNGYLPRDKVLPGGILRSGSSLLRFEVINASQLVPEGRFVIPYVWIPCLCAAYENIGVFGNFNYLIKMNLHAWIILRDLAILRTYDSFEKTIRNFKSHLLAEGEHVTIGRLHHGGYMTNSNRSAFVPACGHNTCSSPLVDLQRVSVPHP
jgi:hypothetical protein